MSTLGFSGAGCAGASLASFAARRALKNKFQKLINIVTNILSRLIYYQGCGNIWSEHLSLGKSQWKFYLSEKKVTCPDFFVEFGTTMYALHISSPWNFKVVNGTYDLFRFLHIFSRLQKLYKMVHWVPVISLCMKKSTKYFPTDFHIWHCKVVSGSYDKSFFLNIRKLRNGRTTLHFHGDDMLIYWVDLLII